MRANVEHNQILHEHVLILSVETMPAPHVPAAERLTVDDLGYKDDRIIHVTARFGYMDPTNVPGLLPLIRDADDRRPAPDATAVVLPVAHRDSPGPYAGHEPLAQAAVHRDITDHRRRRRVLPASPRAHRHRGLAHRALASTQAERWPAFPRKRLVEAAQPGAGAVPMCRWYCSTGCCRSRPVGVRVFPGLTGLLHGEGVSSGGPGSALLVPAGYAGVAAGRIIRCSW